MATLMRLPRELRDEIIRFAVAVPGPPPAPATIPMFKAPVSYNDRSVPRKIKVEFRSSELRADEATTVYEAISILPRGHDNWDDLDLMLQGPARVFALCQF
ncbi:hypothetical protein C8034_v008105 [Colletotrichum sidae]|uniref:Uncharacterized protein n=1 Tax=Colletotrichum sidae TaxID=1347389 RepID=A0A4R8TRJ7_9PEZI|nr:hypothetical protein C8034_v008105 [Colletotrichum sidae]